jgi:ABC-2 type transport system ATP-binding protein
VVGLNGAGKTTLMRLILGMLRPDAGQALVLGHDTRSAPAELWTRVGHLIETPFAYPELTVAENLTAAALLHGVEQSRIASAVDQMVDRFQLSKWAGKRARALSLGNRQRLGLASALIHQPTVLVLDEPANALDPAGVVFIRDLLRSSAEMGAAVLVSSHHLDELARISDRVTVMHRGRLINTLDPGSDNLEERFFDLVFEADVGIVGGTG